VQLVDGMPHLVPITKGVRTNLRPAGIPNVLLALGNLIEIRRQSTFRLEHVDLKCQAAPAW
jgi:hypothetical protein